MYEGMFCDEAYHGTGLYKFADGSVYEGHWHRGTRFGHGHLRSSEGWTYEEGFNTNKRHGYGVINYNDGSMYLGQWYYDKTGQGCDYHPLFVMCTKEKLKMATCMATVRRCTRMVAVMRVISRITRDTERVSFETLDGTQSFGTFRDDQKHGEHVVKAMIPIEEEGQDNFEIRIGVYDMGEFLSGNSSTAIPWYQGGSRICSRKTLRCLTACIPWW